MMAEPRDKDDDESEPRITGAQLRQWRKSVAISQDELARRMYLSDFLIVKWERGERPIPAEVYQRIFAAIASAHRERGDALDRTARDFAVYGVFLR